MRIRVVRWLFFSVLIGLLPIIASAISLKMKGTGPTAARLLTHGELLLIASALCAAALGEIIGSGPRFAVAKLIAGGSTLIVLLLTAQAFVELSAQHVAKGPVISSASCVALAEV
jgi:hypothetical protein